MSFTHRNSQENTTSNGTSLTITKPTDLVAGDLMVAAIGKDDDVAISSAPSGWSKIAGQNTITGNDISSWFGYKVADAGDVAASDFTWSGDSEDWSGVISAFIPSDLGATFVGVSSDVLRQNDATPVSNSLTTTTGNLLVGYCTSAQADTGGLGTATAGYTDAGNPSSGTGNGDNGTILAYDLSSPGGSVTYEANNAESTAESHPYVAEFFDDSMSDQGITPAAVTVSITTSSMVITVGSVAITPVGATVTVGAGSMVATTGSVAITPAAVTVTVTPSSMVATVGSVAVVPDTVAVTVTSGTITVTISGSVDRSQVIFMESDGLFVFLYANHDFVSTEIVGALNDINGTENIGYCEAYRTYLDG